jgi:rRNA-processing protein FCF1
VELKGKAYGRDGCGEKDAQICWDQEGHWPEGCSSVCRPAPWTGYCLQLIIGRRISRRQSRTANGRTGEMALFEKCMGLIYGCRAARVHVLTPFPTALRSAPRSFSKQTWHWSHLISRLVRRPPPLPIIKFCSVLVDTNFFNHTIQNKLDLLSAAMDALYAKCNVFVTDCVVSEMERLGSRYRIALQTARDPRWERLRCDHKVYADDCIVDRVMKHKIYIVATNDRYAGAISPSINVC